MVSLPNWALVSAAAAMWALALLLLYRHARGLRGKLLQLTAEYAGAQRRARRDAEEARQQAAAEVLGEMVGLLDNLDRALQAAQAHPLQEPAAAALVEGVRLSQRQFLEGLRRFQVQPFEAQGQPFDPHLHEAVHQVQSADFAPGTVAVVYQRGYTHQGRLLRAARVAVVSTTLPDTEAEARTG